MSQRHKIEKKNDKTELNREPTTIFNFKIQLM